MSKSVVNRVTNSDMMLNTFCVWMLTIGFPNSASPNCAFIGAHFVHGVMCRIVVLEALFSRPLSRLKN
jgi:hypothetical protein